MIFQFNMVVIQDFAFCLCAGTTYMCLFALYIGMVRKYVLRPGVLFFIRSPEDPNTRLLHEALVRPFRFQISRIALSVLVYMLFILIGFGAVTHGLRLLGSKLLPIRISWSAPVVALLTGPVMLRRMGLMRKYVRQYWVRAFAASAAQMRLSSFILGKDDPRERGHVCYRDLAAWFQGCKPDYTHPMTDVQAADEFRDTSVKAVFVPDGNFVRVPRHDTVSRKYVRQLFVPVTKDDVLLRKNNVSTVKFDDFDESEDEATTTNQYCVMYRPPMFGFRVITFIFMLWVFSVILIVGVALVANLISRPVSYVLKWLNLWHTVPEGWAIRSLLVSDGQKWSVLSPCLDCTSILLGLRVILAALAKYDAHLMEKHLGVENEETNGNAGWFTYEHVVQQLQFAIQYFSVILGLVLMLCSVLLLHVYGVDRPMELASKYGYSGTTSTWLIFVHAAFLLWFTAPMFTHHVTEQISRVWTLGVHLAAQDSTDRLWKPLLARFSFFLTPLVAVLVILASYQYYMLDTTIRGAVKAVLDTEWSNNILSAVTPLMLVSHAGYTTTLKLRELFSRLNTEVKEQYYSKGKTLDNAVQ